MKEESITIGLYHQTEEMGAKGSKLEDHQGKDTWLSINI